ncbi:MAG: hypothetical protein IJD00_00155 [Clostridia bacterium]|nr:hypothetical protein [Clostridia bacterium]
MDIFKISIICIVAAIFAVIFRQHRPEFSILLALVTAVLALYLVFNALISPISRISQKLEGYGVEISYFKVALKALGIGYVTSFAADICRDAGQTTLASLSETVGKCSIFLLSVPLVINIVDLALGFIK